MRVHESEQEQIDAFKRWWKENGVFTVIILLVALAASFGWRFWQQYQAKESAQASVTYEHMLYALSQKDTQQYSDLADQLQNQYAATPYAKLAALLQAQQEVEAGQYPQALAKLQWVIDKASDKAMAQVARLRAARVQIAQKNYQDALVTLNKVTDPAFRAAMLETKGDALAALGRTAEAKTAYEQALASMSKTEAMYSIVQMKLATLGVGK